MLQTARGRFASGRAGRSWATRTTSGWPTRSIPTRSKRRWRQRVSLEPDDHGLEGTGDLQLRQRAGARAAGLGGQARRAVYANRRRIRGTRGKELSAKPGELIERSFAHTLLSHAGVSRQVR